MSRDRRGVVRILCHAQGRVDGPSHVMSEGRVGGTQYHVHNKVCGPQCVMSKEGGSQNYVQSKVDRPPCVIS